MARTFYTYCMEETDKLARHVGALPGWRAASRRTRQGEPYVEVTRRRSPLGGDRAKCMLLVVAGGRLVFAYSDNDGGALDGEHTSASPMLHLTPRASQLAALWEQFHGMK